jgi:hypothetical protein
MTRRTVESVRSLSAAEIDAVAGGLQYNDNPQNYIMSPSAGGPQNGDAQSLVVMPDPGFVVGGAQSGIGASSYSFGATQTGTF